MSQRASPERPAGPRRRWPLVVAILVVVALAGGAWWLLRGVDPVGVWVGHLDNLQLELHVQDDGTFDWYLSTSGAQPANGGRPRVAQWKGTWRMSEGELELTYEPKAPRNEGGVRYGRFSDGMLRTTFGLGGERATLRRQAP